MARFPEDERAPAGFFLVSVPPLVLAIVVDAFVRLSMRDAWGAAMLGAGAAFILAGFAALLRTRRTSRPILGVMLVLTALFAACLWRSGGAGTSIPWLFAVPLVGFFLLPRRSALLLTALAAGIAFAAEASRLLHAAWAPAILLPRAVEIYLGLAGVALLAFLLSSAASGEQARVLARRTALAENVDALKRETALRRQTQKSLEATVLQLRRVQTELSRALDFARREQIRLQYVLNELPVGVLILQAPDGAVATVNRAAADIIGWEPSADASIAALYAACRPVREGGTPLPEEEWPFAQTLRTGKPAQSASVFIQRTPDERLNLFIASTPLYEGGRMDTVLVIIQDRTREYVANRAKTDFVSIASHQLHTPLNAIRWMAETLLDGHAGALKPKQAQLMRQIDQSNLRMISLVTSLLNVSRLETGTIAVKPAAADLRAAVREALRVLQADILAKHLRVAVDVDRAPAAYVADEGLLQILLQNLLSNAVKYTPDGGSVAVRVGVSKPGETVAGRTLQEPWLLLVVADTGCGIPRAAQDRIYTKMFRADNARAQSTQGTGLGLYTVKTAAAMVGGDTWFASRLNHGSTFAVALPPRGMRPRKGSQTLEQVM